MKDITQGAGLKALFQLSGEKVLCAFDFDGTLSATVPKPQDAMLDPHVLQSLTALSAHAPVAVVSGRSRADLLMFFPSPFPYMIGNHGAEGLPRSHPRLPKRHAREWLPVVTDALRHEIREGSARIEDKGLSLTVHSALPDVHERMASLQPALHGARVFPGIHTSNIVDEKAPTKADALLRLLQHARCDCAVFVGNEETDEHVFRLHDPRILGIRVGPCTETAAEFLLPSQDKILWLIRTMTDILGPGKKGIS